MATVRADRLAASAARIGCTVEELERWIDAALADAPPLTDAQKARVRRALLAPAALIDPIEGTA